MRLSVQERQEPPRGSRHQCGLCGLTFVWDPEVGASACSRCPIGRGCGLVVCPNCGYEFPARPTLAGALARALGLRRPGQARPRG